jgi:hypothetical protein
MKTIFVIKLPFMAAILSGLLLPGVAGAYTFDPLHKEAHIKKYGAVIEQYDLDPVDLNTHAVLLATGANDSNKIAGSNINAMVLGGRIFSDQSTFIASSIFDIAKLNSDAIILDTANQSYTRFALDLSSDISKSATVGAWNGSIGATVKTLFYEAGVAYNQSTYNQDTTLSQKGAGTMSQYNYGFLAMDVEKNKADWSMYLTGMPLDVTDGMYPDEAKYITLVDAMDSGSGQVYKKIDTLKVYDDAGAGKYFGSPLANYQMLKLFELRFNQLETQLRSAIAAGQTDVERSTWVDMIRLRSNINQSIKTFLGVWGDAFVTNLGGSHALLATAVYDSQGAAHSYESNYAGAVSLKYSGLVAGVDIKGQLGRYTKGAGGSTKGSFSVTGTEIPTTDLNAAQQFARSLQDNLNTFIMNTDKQLVIPDKVIGNVTFPTLPDPVAPYKPDGPEPPTKTLAELKAAQELVKMGWDPDKLPAYLKDQLAKTRQDAVPPSAAASMDAKSQTLASQGVGAGVVLPAATGEGQQAANSNHPEDGSVAAIRARNKAATQLVRSIAARRGNVSIAADDQPVSLLKTSYGLTGSDRVNAKKLRVQQRLLKAKGKQLRKLEKRRTRKLQQFANQSLSPKPLAFEVAAAATPVPGCQVNNQIKPCSLAITHFDTLPYVERLPALRPNLYIPVWTDPTSGHVYDLNGPNSPNAAPNAAVMLSYVNRYQTIANYLNFISRSPYSNVTQSNVNTLQAWLGRFTNTVMSEINLAMSSGVDVSDCKVWELVTQNIEMPQYTGDCVSNTLSIVGDETSASPTTTLRAALANIDMYAYVKMLAEDPVRFRIIAMGQGGYLPFVTGSDDGGVYKLTISSIGGGSPTYGQIFAKFALTRLLSNQKPGDLLASMPADLASQSAWFPIYGFTPNGGAPLLRFQLFANDKLILIGRQYMVLPGAEASSLGNPEKETQVNTVSPAPLTGFAENSIKPTLDLSIPEAKAQSDRWDAAQQWWRAANVKLGFDAYGLNQSVGRTCLANGKDGCTPYDNGFFDNELSWNYSLWFKESPNVSADNRFENQVMLLKLTSDNNVDPPATLGVGSYGLERTNVLMSLTDKVGDLVVQSVHSSDPNPGHFARDEAIALVPVNSNTVSYEDPIMTDSNAPTWATPVKSQAISPGSLMPNIMQRNVSSGSDNGASPLDSFYRKQIYSGAAGY